MSQFMELADLFSCNCITESLAAYWLLGEEHLGPSNPQIPCWPSLQTFQSMALYPSMLFILQSL